MSLTLTGGGSLKSSSCNDLKEADSIVEQVFMAMKIGSLAQVEGLTKQTSAESLFCYDKEGHTLAHWAAKRENVSFLQHLASIIPSSNFHQPSKDDVGMYPIHWAVTNGCIPNIAFLLSIGMRDEVVLEYRDRSGCTALLVAAQYGHANVCAFLLKHGANMYALDNSEDGALHWAAYKGAIGVVGLLCYFVIELDLVDKYGHTPLHLASLRGHTEAVQYLLEECETRSKNYRQRRINLTKYLSTQDKNNKTAYDLAISKNKRGCQIVLLQELQQKRNCWCLPLLKQTCSIREWKLWMGWNPSSNNLDDVSFKQRKTTWPMCLAIATTSIAFSLYPTRFLNAEEGALFNYLGLHLVTLVCMCLMTCFYLLTWKTNPGSLSNNKLTKELQLLYEATLDSYATTNPVDSHQLCHSCHVVRPPRSKHCRIQRKCVLMFDHHCPFVGNTIGLYNYHYFYLFLVFITFSEMGFTMTWILYLRHCSKIQSFDLLSFLGGLFVCIFMIPSVTMFLYHTNLIVRNLTTNEHQNFFRYNYLKDELGRYHNAYDRGILHNFHSRLCPGPWTYALPPNTRPQEPLQDFEEHKSLIVADANELLE